MNRILISTPCNQMYHPISADCRASLVAWHVSNNDELVFIHTTQDILLHRSRNQVVEIALEYEFSHILFVDSDMVFGKKDLKTLLGHHKAIVSGLCFDSWDGERPVPFNWKDGKADPIADFNEPGLVKVDATGTGFILIDTKVFEKVKFPWFDMKDFLGEDVFFCKQAGEAGFDVWVDRDMVIGHISKQVRINWGPKGQRAEAVHG